MRVPLTLLSESYRNTRALQPEKVAALASGIERLGLQTPISVRAIKSVRSGQTVDAWAIVTGRHRVAAARKLGWTEIEATLFDGDEIDARLWQLAENLHRAELTALERAENEAEWIRLTEEKNNGPSWADIPRGRGQPQGGINAATRELGITRQEGQRAAKIASLSAEAKETARQAGLDDNQAEYGEDDNHDGDDRDECYKPCKGTNFLGDHLAELIVLLFYRLFLGLKVRIFLLYFFLGVKLHCAK